MNDKTVKWWKAAGVRSIRTIAQTAAGCIGGAALFSDVSWPIVISSAILAGVVSILTSVAGLPEVE